MDEAVKKYFDEYTANSFINEVGLYSKIYIGLISTNLRNPTNEDLILFDSIFNNDNTSIMSYCLGCECKNTFIAINDDGDNRLINYEIIELLDRYRKIGKTIDLPQMIINHKEYYFREFRCALNKSHSLFITCKIEKEGNELVIRKIGQFPSLADLQFPEVKKYRKILGDGYYKEYTKAIGLYANGIGVGSFVYLRRIYENLVEEVHNEYKTKPEWVDSEYIGKRFNEKIDYLESIGAKIFPEEITGIKTQIYSVISKGIHEYTEEECMTLFDPLKFCIEAILDHKHEKEERKKKGEAARKALQSKQ